jgi:hypothetical protein
MILIRLSLLTTFPKRLNFLAAFFMQFDQGYHHHKKKTKSYGNAKRISKRQGCKRNN